MLLCIVVNGFSFFFFPFHLRYDMVVNDISEFLKCLWLLCFIWHCGISIQLRFLWKFRCLHAFATCKPFKLIIYCCRGGGDLLRQLHRLAEAESNLVIHQKRLSEIEAKVAVSSFYQIKGRRIMHLVLVKINCFWNRNCLVAIMSLFTHFLLTGSICTSPLTYRWHGMIKRFKSRAIGSCWSCYIHVFSMLMLVLCSILCHVVA